MRILSTFLLLAASCTFASAATVSFDCTNPGTNNIASFANGAGTTSFNCAGFGAPSGFEITAVSVLGRVDYQFGTDPGPNTVEVNFDLPLAFIPNPLVVSNSGGESSVGIAQTPSNLSAGLPTLNYAAFSVDAKSTVTAGAVASSSARMTVTYTYEETFNSTVPEPSTFALVGAILTLAGLRKYRR